MRAATKGRLDVLRRGGTDGPDVGYGSRWEHGVLAGVAAGLLLLCLTTWFTASSPYGTASATGYESHGIGGVGLVGAIWVAVFAVGNARGGWGARRLRVTPSDLGHGALAVGGVLVVTYLFRVTAPPDFAEVTVSTGFGATAFDPVDEQATSEIVTTATASLWLGLLLAAVMMFAAARLLTLRGELRPHQLWRAFGSEAILRGDPAKRS